MELITFIALVETKSLHMPLKVSTYDNKENLLYILNALGVYWEMCIVIANNCVQPVALKFSGSTLNNIKLFQWEWLYLPNM